MITQTETRNIINHYHYWQHDAIVADLDAKRNNFYVLCSNLYNDFNIATIIRNANAFLAKKVILYGSKQFDRRGAVGTHRYTHFEHFKEQEGLNIFLKEKKFSRIVGIDNVENSIPITKYDWGTPTESEDVLMIFGQEQVGIPEHLLDLCDDVVYIPQYGSVRSLNVGTSSGIAMYDFCSKVVKT